MPKVEKTIYFKNYQNKIEHSYVIYMNFKSTLYKIDNCKLNNEKLLTIKTHLHRPYGFTICLVSIVNK